MTKPTSAAFFSYSRQDAEFVLKLAKDLRAAGSAVWLDQLDIKPGEHWDAAVEDALARSLVMLVVLSPSSVASNNVMDEVSFALEEKKPLIPILYRECKIPFRLRRMQYVDFRVDYENGLRMLLENLSFPTEAEAETLPSPSVKEKSAPEIAPQATPQVAARPPQQPPSVPPASLGPAARKPELVAAKDVQQRPAAAIANQQQSKTAAPKSSRLKYFVAAIVTLIAIIVVVRLANTPKKSSYVYRPPEPVVTREAPVARTPPPASHPQSTYVAPQEPNITPWLAGFISASEGPIVSELSRYYDNTVSPYYGMRVANWSDIERDKENYFKRFPTLHYTLVGQPKFYRQGQGQAVVSFDLEYSAVRYDGHQSSGTVNTVLNVRLVNRQWKITAIR